MLKSRLPHESLLKRVVSVRAAFGFNGSRIMKRPMAALLSEVTPLNARNPEGPTLPPFNLCQGRSGGKVPFGSGCAPLVRPIPGESP